MATTKYKDSGIPWIGMIPEDWEVNKAKFTFTREIARVMLTLFYLLQLKNLE